MVNFICVIDWDVVCEMVEPIIEFLIIKLRSYPSINIEFSKILFSNWALGTYPYLVSLGGSGSQSGYQGYNPGNPRNIYETPL
jgi:hypothetical protein